MRSCETAGYDFGQKSVTYVKQPDESTVRDIRHGGLHEVQRE